MSDAAAKAVVLINAAATWYMVGLIWMVQIVHYKLFDRVGAEGFAAYEADHARLITPIVGVPMLIEIATAAALLTVAPEIIPRSWAIGGVAAVLAIWLTTAALSIPYHNQLHEGFTDAAYRGLVGTNWIRTVLWSARGGLMAAALWRLLR